MRYDISFLWSAAFALRIAAFVLWNTHFVFRRAASVSQGTIRPQRLKYAAATGLFRAAVVEVRPCGHRLTVSKALKACQEASRPREWIPNNMVHCSGSELPSFSVTIICCPDLRLLSVTEEPAQPHLIYEAADASRPNNPVPDHFLGGCTRKLRVHALPGDLCGHVAEDERPNFHRDDGRIRQFKVYTLFSIPADTTLRRRTNSLLAATQEEDCLCLGLRKFGFASNGVTTSS